MKTETMMSEAFKAIGLTPCEAAFNLALAKYQNNGGTYERALAMLDAAYGKGSGGQAKIPGNGRHVHANTSRDGDAGRSDDVVKASGDSPASPSTPVRVVEHKRHLPGHAKRGAEAIAAVQPTMAKSAFASIKLDDGRTIAEVRWSEAVPLAQRHSRNARILIAAHNYAIPADPTTPLGEMVPPDEQKNIANMMERINAH